MSLQKHPQSSYYTYDTAITIVTAITTTVI